jgi:SAM-dependent methyltransferase
VLRPGGVALLSVHGAYAFEQFRRGQAKTTWCRPGAFDRPPLGREEFAYEPYARSVFNRADLPGVGAAYGLAFHGRDYVRRHWSRWLAIERVLERGLTAWQDLVVCVRSPATG